MPVADGKPGEEVQIDFGYLGMISRRGPAAEAARAGVHRGAVAVLLRVLDVLADDGRGDRRAARRHGRFSAACSRCSCRTTSSRWWIRRTGWSRGGTGSGWSTRRPAAWSWTRPGSAPPGQGAGGKRGEVRPGQLLRRGAVRRHRRRAAPGGGLVPHPGRDAGARHHPPAARGGVRAAGGAGAAARAGASRTGCRRGARPRCSAISMSGRRTRSTRCPTA